MFKTVVLSLVAAGSLSAQAATLLFKPHAEGLTPETGYKRMVDSYPCIQGEDILTKVEFNSPHYIQNCDLTNIGWVNVTVDSKNVIPDTVLGGAAGDPYDFRILIPNNYNKWGETEYINIYTCGSSRKDEPGLFPLPAGSLNNARQNFKKIMDLKRAGRNFKVDLYYNEFSKSGKCIGNITAVDPKVQSNAWLAKVIGENRTTEHKGKTFFGKACSLYLTKLPGDKPTFYIVVGYQNAANLNDYIGTVSTQSISTVNSPVIGFESAESWGNGSTRNRVTIYMDKNGTPVRAKGESDLKTISCKLDQN